MLIANYPVFWTYEGVAYHAFSAPVDPDLKPVYRFWSQRRAAHFYTISEQEKDIADRATIGYMWTYEGVAFYAYPEGHQPAGAKPVYRFWSDTSGQAFLHDQRAGEAEIVDQYSYTWTLEGVAWYAYE